MTDFTRKYINIINRRQIVKAICKVETSDIEPFEGNELVVENPIVINPAFYLVKNSLELETLFSNTTFPDGGATVWLAPANYLVSPDLIDVPDNVILEGTGEGSVIGFTGAASVFYIRLGSYAGLKNLAVDRTISDFVAPIISMTGANAFIKDCLINELLNAGPDSPSIEMTNSNQVVDGCILNVDVRGSGNNGIVVATTSANATIRGNTINNYNIAVFLIGGSSVVVLDNVKVVENIITSSNRAINAVFCVDNLISCNQFISNGGATSTGNILLTDCNRINIVNNLFLNLANVASGLVIVDTGTGVMENMLIDTNIFNGFSTTSAINYTANVSALISVQNNHFGTSVDLPFEGIGRMTGCFIPTGDTLVPLSGIQQSASANRAIFQDTFGSGGVLTPNLQYERFEINIGVNPLTINLPNSGANNAGKQLAFSITISNAGAIGSFITATTTSGWTTLTFGGIATFYSVFLWNGSSWTLREVSENVSVI